MKTADFDYVLPSELIAQTPIEPRDHSRLLVLHRTNHILEHRRFSQIVDYLHEGDVLVLNESRVIPARLFGRKIGSGGKVEILLLRRLSPTIWETLVKPGRRVGKGTVIEIGANIPENGSNSVESTVEVIDEQEGGIKTIHFSREEVLEKAGQIPLPPYVRVPLATPERYQTVYARVDGSVAAPTAGLHLTTQLLEAIRGKGVELAPVTLHVGLDSFRPVQAEDPTRHSLHSEYGELSPEAVSLLERAKTEGRRVICVGTTTVRLLEAIAQLGGGVRPWKGWTNLFILPGHRFQVVDALITNFHLPRSTLLMLVSAFAGRELIDHAYQEAIRHRYRFYSFGDAMLIL